MGTARPVFPADRQSSFPSPCPQDATARVGAAGSPGRGLWCVPSWGTQGAEGTLLSQGCVSSCRRAEMPGHWVPTCCPARCRGTLTRVPPSRAPAATRGHGGGGKLWSGSGGGWRSGPGPGRQQRSLGGPGPPTHGGRCPGPGFPHTSTLCSAQPTAGRCRRGMLLRCCLPRACC